MKKNKNYSFRNDRNNIFAILGDYKRILMPLVFILAVLLTVGIALSANKRAAQKMVSTEDEGIAAATLEIPDGIREIETNAFENNKGLKEIIVPNSVTKISDAFIGCQNLTKVTLPEGLAEIGYYTFGRCAKLESLVIPDGVSYIGSYAFEDCKNLKELVIPASVTNIVDTAFNGCQKLVCTVSNGSYAQQYCEAKGIKYTVK